MNKIQTTLVAPALAALMLVGGGIAGYASLASAQTTDTAAAAVTAQTNTPTTSVSAETATGSGATQTVPARQFDPHQGGHVGKNGVKDVLLTGDNAAKATSAALAAVPGGTVERVETDAEGAAYEAHMTKADGSHVTVKMDSNFNVTTTESGPNGR